MSNTNDMTHETIQLYGVSTHNLKGINVEFPLGRYTVVTGVSGSGKSSLVFDTLYGESYRRYVESLSSFARQYLKALPKCIIEEARNLPPAIAVQQTRSNASARSTVGTLTELIDMFRILFVHLGEIICPDCAVAVRRDHEAGIVAALNADFAGEEILVTAPLAQPDKIKSAIWKEQLSAMGFVRLYAAGELVRIADASAAQLKCAKIVIDRVKVAEEKSARLTEAVKLGLRAGQGSLEVIVPKRGNKVVAFCTHLRCNICGKQFRTPSVAALNFNHPAGACAVCQGFGRTMEVDRLKVIPDESSSLAAQGVAPWNFGKHAMIYRWALASAKKVGIKPDLPFSKYGPDEWRWLYQGDGKSFVGLDGYFKYLEEKRYKAHYRIHAARFRKYVVCPSCHGERLSRESLALRIASLNIADMGRLPTAKLLAWVKALAGQAPQSNAAQRLGVAAGELNIGVAEALEELTTRLGYLIKVGLNYLALERTARTLSGGELQRVNLARALGSALTGTLFCLDEPSSGLHARDSRNLLDVVRELTAQGNTVVVVEHEKTLIDEADHLIEIGPAAGHKGGEVVFTGSPGLFTAEHATLWPQGVMQGEKLLEFIELSGVTTHNLKGVTSRIPLQQLTVVCGVSGSGKSSLVSATLYPALAQLLGMKLDDLETEARYEKIGPTALIKRRLGEVVHVAQKSIGRSTRSNIATYLGFFDDIRKLLAQTPLARAKKLTPGSFSFNTTGGRCECCKGLGTVIEDLSFLGEMAIECPDCHGKRFLPAILEVKYRDRNLLDILDLTLTEAREFFFDRSQTSAILDSAIAMGLGYVRLGQSTSSFSGGEAQRLKLLNLLIENREDKPKLLIFDEPTTGLSDRDVLLLLGKLRQLVQEGHTVVVVEHHLGIIRAADWLIEVGPEAADDGGQIVYQGAPAGLKDVAASRTAPFLSQKGRDMHVAHKH